MSKFNWDRFYDELESADPKKFPYHIWFVREMTNLSFNIMFGIVSAFMLWVIMGITLKVLATDYPDWTFKQFQTAICEQK